MPKKKDTLKKVAGACLYCNSAEDNEFKFGKLIFNKKHNIRVHHYCLLFASGLCQRGEVNDENGIEGFLVPDILEEYKRGKSLRCSYCHQRNALVGCVIKACRSSYHFGCGVERKAIFLFYDNFISYCCRHRPQQTPPEILPENPTSTCPICLESVESQVSEDTLRTPCCTNSWFHRICVQRQALSAGYFFRCGICNNKEDFQREMRQFGIYIPEQDAAWEREENAYQDLYQRHNQCDIKPCICPKGRKYHPTRGKWEIVLCDTCGSRGCHLTCGALTNQWDDWVCDQCEEVVDRINTERYGSSSKPKKSSKKTSAKPTTPNGQRKEKLEGKSPRTPLPSRKLIKKKSAPSTCPSLSPPTPMGNLSELSIHLPSVSASPNDAIYLADSGQCSSSPPCLIKQSPYDNGEDRKRTPVKTPCKGPTSSCRKHLGLSSPPHFCCTSEDSLTHSHESIPPSLSVVEVDANKAKCFHSKPQNHVCPKYSNSSPSSAVKTTSRMSMRGPATNTPSFNLSSLTKPGTRIHLCARHRQQVQHSWNTDNSTGSTSSDSSSSSSSDEMDFDPVRLSPDGKVSSKGPPYSGSLPNGVKSIEDVTNGNAVVQLKPLSNLIPVLFQSVSVASDDSESQSILGSALAKEVHDSTTPKPKIQHTCSKRKLENKEVSAPRKKLKIGKSPPPKNVENKSPVPRKVMSTTTSPQKSSISKMGKSAKESPLKKKADVPQLKTTKPATEKLNLALSGLFKKKPAGSNLLKVKMGNHFKAQALKITHKAQSFQIKTKAGNASGVKVIPKTKKMCPHKAKMQVKAHQKKQSTIDRYLKVWVSRSEKMNSTPTVQSNPNSTIPSTHLLTPKINTDNTATPKVVVAKIPSLEKSVDNTGTQNNVESKTVSVHKCTVRTVTPRKIEVKLSAIPNINANQKSTLKLQKVTDQKSTPKKVSDMTLTLNNAVDKTSTPKTVAVRTPTLKKVANKIPASKTVADQKSTPNKAADKIPTPKKAADQKSTPKKPADKIPTPKKAADQKSIPKKVADKIPTSKTVADQKSTPKKTADQKSTPKKPADKIPTTKKVPNEKSTPKTFTDQKSTPKKIADKLPTPKKVEDEKSTPAKILAEKTPTPKQLSEQKSTPKKVTVQKSTPKKLADQKSTLMKVADKTPTPKKIPGQKSTLKNKVAVTTATPKKDIASKKHDKTATPTKADRKTEVKDQNIANSPLKGLKWKNDDDVGQPPKIPKMDDAAEVSFSQQKDIFLESLTNSDKQKQIAGVPKLSQGFQTGTDKLETSNLRDLLLKSPTLPINDAYCFTPVQSPSKSECKLNSISQSKSKTNRLTRSAKRWNVRMHSGQIKFSKSPPEKSPDESSPATTTKVNSGNQFAFTDAEREISWNKDLGKVPTRNAESQTISVLKTPLRKVGYQYPIRSSPRLIKERTTKIPISPSVSALLPADTKVWVPSDDEDSIALASIDKPLGKPSLKIQPLVSINKTLRKPSLKIQPLASINKTLGKPSLKIQPLARQLDEMFTSKEVSNQEQSPTKKKEVSNQEQSPTKKTPKIRMEILFADGSSTFHQGRGRLSMKCIPQPKPTAMSQERCFQELQEINKAVMSTVLNESLDKLSSSPDKEALKKVDVLATSLKEMDEEMNQDQDELDLNQNNKMKPDGNETDATIDNDTDATFDNDTDETIEYNYDSVGGEADISSDSSSPDKAQDILVRRSSRFESSTPSKGGILVRRSRRYQPGSNVEIVDLELVKNDGPCDSCRHQRRRCIHWVRQSAKKRYRKSAVVNSDALSPSIQEDRDDLTEEDDHEISINEFTKVSMVDFTEPSSEQLSQGKVCTSDTDEFESCLDHLSSQEEEEKIPLAVTPGKHATKSSRGRPKKYKCIFTRRRGNGKVMKNNVKISMPKVSKKDGKQEHVKESQKDESELEADWKYKTVFLSDLDAEESQLNVNNNNNNNKQAKDEAGENGPADEKANDKCNIGVGDLTMKDFLFDSIKQGKKPDEDQSGNDSTFVVDLDDDSEVEIWKPLLPKESHIIYNSIGCQKTSAEFEDSGQLERWIDLDEKTSDVPKEIGDSHVLSSADESVILLSGPETPHQSPESGIVLNDSNHSSKDSQDSHIFSLSDIVSDMIVLETKKRANESQMLVKPTKNDQVPSLISPNGNGLVPKTAAEDMASQKVEGNQCSEQKNEVQPAANGIENNCKTAQHNQDESLAETPAVKPPNISPTQYISPYACRSRHKHGSSCKVKHNHYPVCDSPHLHGPGSRSRRGKKKKSKKIPVHVHKPKCLAPHLHGPQPLNGRRVAKEVVKDNTGTTEKESDETDMEDEANNFLGFTTGEIQVVHNSAMTQGNNNL